MELRGEYFSTIYISCHELKNATHQHGPYVGFYIKDPKQRHIHKAVVRDRVLHHAIFSILNPIFELTFIPRSFSCRIGEGTHRGIDVLEKMLIKTSENYTKPCFALKCDIRKFFDSVNHSILLNIIKKRVKDNKAIWLLNEIIESYSVAVSPRERETNVPRKGLPIGNLTSQLFANIYLNELDQFIKQRMKIKDYVRYTDDFVIVAEKSLDLKEIINPIQLFLKNELKLEIHPQKISIKRFHQGVDF